MLSRILGVLLLSIGLLTGTAGGAQAVINAEPDGMRHPYVGLVTDTQGFCSGSLISPTVFITAAHCADAGATVYVTVDPDASAVFDNPIGVPPTGADYVTGTFYPDPDFCIACGPGLPGFATGDVAVVILDDPINVSSYASLPSVGQVDRLAQKQTLTAVGYGIRARENKLVDEYAVRYMAPLQIIQDNNVVADEFLKLTANRAKDKGAICSGDSGGPILLGSTILAVNSFGNGVCGASPSYAYRIDTVEALNFIQSIITLHA
jgi:hypothetical protein